MLTDFHNPTMAKNIWGLSGYYLPLIVVNLYHPVLEKILVSLEKKTDQITHSPPIP